MNWTWACFIVALAIIVLIGFLNYASGAWKNAQEQRNHNLLLARIERGLPVDDLTVNEAEPK